MNLFDLVGGLVILLSAGIGFSRGMIMELVGLFAFTLAATASVYLMPLTAPFARAEVHPTWAANATAVVVTFLIVYFGVRLLGGGVSRSLKSQATLGTLDRTFGLAFGTVRALVVLGVVYLVFDTNPFGRAPDILTQAKLFPLARGSGLVMAELAPGGMRRMQGFGASLKARLGGGDAPSAQTGEDVDSPASDSGAYPSPAPIYPVDTVASPKRHPRRHDPDQVE